MMTTTHTDIVSKVMQISSEPQDVATSGQNVQKLTGGEFPPVVAAAAAAADRSANARGSSQTAPLERDIIDAIVTTLTAAIVSEWGGPSGASGGSGRGTNHAADPSEEHEAPGSTEVDDSFDRCA
ncbi:MAG: hypothetical protein ABR606_02705 [Vicinamibacterales bacterium]